MPLKNRRNDLTRAVKYLKHTGLSLAEILIALVVMGVLVGFAAKATSGGSCSDNDVVNAKIANLNNDLSSVMQMAYAKEGKLVNSMTPEELLRKYYKVVGKGEVVTYAEDDFHYDLFGAGNTVRFKNRDGIELFVPKTWDTSQYNYNNQNNPLEANGFLVEANIDCATRCFAMPDNGDSVKIFKKGCKALNAYTDEALDLAWKTNKGTTSTLIWPYISSVPIVTPSPPDPLSEPPPIGPCKNRLSFNVKTNGYNVKIDVTGHLGGGCWGSATKSCSYVINDPCGATPTNPVVKVRIYKDCGSPVYKDESYANTATTGNINLGTITAY